MPKITSLFRLVFILTFCFIFHGCIVVRDSSNVHIRKNKKSILSERHFPDSLPSSPVKDSNPSILDHEIEVSDFIRFSNTENSTFFISVVNYHTNTYLEARFKEYTTDTIRFNQDSIPNATDIGEITILPGSMILEVISKDLNKNRSLEYDIIFHPDNISLDTLKKRNKHSYGAEFSIIGEKGAVINETISFENFKANELEKGLLHLYSGEITRKNRRNSKFIILNDLTSGSTIFEALLTLDASDTDNIPQKCENKFRIRCRDLGFTNVKTINISEREDLEWNEKFLKAINLNTYYVCKLKCINE